MDQFWLTDEQFARIAPHLPADTRGKERVDDRRVISGIVHVLKSGGRWTDAPREVYGLKKTLYNRFVRWAAKGLWVALFETLAQAGGPPSQVLIDSTAVKAHRCAAGGKGGGADPSDRSLAGRSHDQDLDAAKRFFRKMLQHQPLLAPDRIGTDGAGPYSPDIVDSRKAGLLPRVPVHYVTKHLQQGVENNHFRVKRSMPRVGGFRSFNTARRMIQGFEAMLWLRKGFGFASAWTYASRTTCSHSASGFPRGTKRESGTVEVVPRSVSGFATGPRRGEVLRDAEAITEEVGFAEHE